MLKMTTNQGETVTFYREPAYGNPMIAVIDCVDGATVALTKTDGYVMQLDRGYIDALAEYTKNYADRRSQNAMRAEAERMLARINADCECVASQERS